MNTTENDWLRFFVLAGYGARTVLYIGLGILAFGIVWGQGASNEVSQEGVFQELFSRPFGNITLAIVALGLFCYAIWRGIQIVFNTERFDSDAKGYLQRGFLGLSGLIHAVAGVVAVKMLLNGGSSGSGNSAVEWTGKLMSQPWGIWLVGVLGVGLILFAGTQLRHAIKADFMNKFRTGTMSKEEKESAKTAGVTGYFARTVVYLILGGCLISAALTANPNEAADLDEALHVLLQQPYGSWLLILMAIGLVAFGVYCFFEARYRKINRGAVA